MRGLSVAELMLAWASWKGNMAGHTGVALQRHRGMGGQDILHLRTEVLCGSAQGIPVLTQVTRILYDADLFFRSGCRELAAIQKRMNGLRALNLN